MNISNKKVLALAVASACAGSAAAANITLPNTAAASPLYASQISPGAGVALTNTNLLGGLIGWGFSSGTAVFVRYDLSGGAKFTADPSAMTLGHDSTVSAMPNATATKSAGGAGASNAIYQVSSTNSANTVSTANTLLTLAGITATSTAADITITQSIYDTSSNAVAGGATGKLATSKVGTIVSFTSAYSATAAAGTAATADVANTYLGFTGSANSAALGTFTLSNTANANTSAGAAADVANVLAAGSSLTVTGDFTAVANANGTYTTPAATRVFLGSSTCGLSQVAANSVSATSAVFTPTTPAPILANTLCMVAQGTTAIPVGSYTAVYTPVAATGYTVSATSSAAIGSIVRNGGQLTTPWMTFASGWISRIILTNSTSTAATYSVAVKGEAGNTVTANSTGATGTVPANGMVVINASDIVSSISGNTRFAATFTFAAARASIDGMAQAVNAATGAISSVTMVAPGTN